MQRNGRESSPISGKKIQLRYSFSKVKFFLYRLRFQGVKLKSRFSRIIQLLIELMVTNWLLKGQSLSSFFRNAHPNLLLQKKTLLENYKSKTVIFFTFRTLHFVDWFAPIHLAIQQDFPGKYEIFYIDFSTTLHRIGRGFEYINFQKQVEERLTQLGISHLYHFSHEELSDFSSHPNPSILITCESIRQESFSVEERIYLPHYILPKSNETDLPSNIRFNHVFLPSIPPYSYRLLKNSKSKTKFHYVGYPKLCTRSAPINSFFDSNLPVVLYAPSLDLKLIFDAIDKGILEIFKEMTFCNIIIKLHPSLASRRHYITTFLSEQLKLEEHIMIDELSGIQSLATESKILVADFGSMGGEYRLRFGKRVVFLETPKKYEGGADLIFRDDFADSICNVKNLGNTISNLLKKGNLSKSELEIMRQKVLSYTGESDKKAARSIDEICSKT